MKFVVQYKPGRDNFLATITEEEDAVVGAHFQYLKGLLSDGKLIFAGRRTDGAFGIAVFVASSEQAAISIKENDPVVKAGVFTATVGQFQFALATDPNLLSER